MVVLGFASRQPIFSPTSVWSRQDLKTYTRVQEKEFNMGWRGTRRDENQVRGRDRDEQL